MSEPVPISAGLQAAYEDLAARTGVVTPLGAIHAADDEPERIAKLDQSWRLAIPKRFWESELSTVDPAIAADLAEWAALETPPNLVILGPVGTGKTWAAIAAVRPAFFAGRPVRFVPIGEMLDSLRPGGPDQAMEHLFHMGFLVVDDIGTERGTDWTAERLFAVVNRRWLELRPTVATCNLEGDELAAALGERTFSRLVRSDALVLTLRGPDRRKS